MDLPRSGVARGTLRLPPASSELICLGIGLGTTADAGCGATQVGTGTVHLMAGVIHLTITTRMTLGRAGTAEMPELVPMIDGTMVTIPGGVMILMSMGGISRRSRHPLPKSGN